MFLVDEAQIAYKQPDLDASMWGFCKCNIALTVFSIQGLSLPLPFFVRTGKLLGAGRTVSVSQTGLIRFIFAAAYGAHRSGRPVSPDGSPTCTPISPSPEMIMTVQQRPGAACLGLSPAEFEELWCSFVSFFSLSFRSDAIRNYVYHSAGAQVVACGCIFG